MPRNSQPPGWRIQRPLIAAILMLSASLAPLSAGIPGPELGIGLLNRLIPWPGLSLADNHRNANFQITPYPAEWLNKLQVGKSTLADVHGIFGEKEERRLTYKRKLLHKKHQGKWFDIYRVVNYSSYEIAKKRNEQHIEKCDWSKQLKKDLRSAFPED